MISIHAPTRGATTYDQTVDYMENISIHAPTRGATGWLNTVEGKLVFQSTLLQEERRRYPMVEVSFQ